MALRLESVVDVTGHLLGGSPISVKHPLNGTKANSIDREHKTASDQDVQCLHIGITSKIYTRHTFDEKWTRLQCKDKGQKECNPQSSFSQALQTIV